jgi:hypothetical protein
MKMSDTHRLKGWFFLPETPADRVPGILTWSQEDGADLELIGGFSPPPAYRPIEGELWATEEFLGDIGTSTIYGELDSGRKACMWGAERGSFKAGMRHEVREEFWHASWLCIGAHIASADTKVLRNSKVALDDLYYLTLDGRFCAPQWATIEGVEQPGERQEDGTYLFPYILPVIGGYRAGHEKGKSVDTVYSIDTHATRPWVSPATEADPALKLQFMTKRRRRGVSIELSVGAQAAVASIDGFPASAQELLRRTQPLLGLMSLATFNSSGLEWMNAETIDDEEVFLFCHAGHRSHPDSTVEAGGPVFTFDDVPLSSFLETWDRLASKEQAVYAWNLVVGLIGHSPIMVEERVSQVLAAAEGFDTWCLDGGQNTSLRNRLVRLYEQLPDQAQAKLQIDVDRWADWAVWARNHVAHGGTKKHRNIADFYQLTVIADSVQLVTYLVALKEFQVPSDNLGRALATHPRLKVLADRCGEISNLPLVTPE